MPQQHKILRQILEVHGCPPGTAQQLQSELRSVYYRHLLPVIERICSELSAPDRLHRVDTLEIDLGELPLETLEAEMGSKFEQVFGDELATAIDDAPQTDPELELFAYFISTGAVPWWAGRPQPDLLEANLRGLIARASGAVQRALRDAPDPERARLRIARAYSDAALLDLAETMLPSLSLACPQWSAAGLAALPPARVTRNIWWEEVLRAAQAERVAGGEPSAGAGRLRFFGALLARVARRLGLEYRALIADFRGALDRGGASPRPWLRELADDLWRELDGDTAASPPASPPLRAEIAGLLRELRALSPSDAGFRARLRALIERLPAPERARVADLLREANGDTDAGTPDRAGLEALASLLREAAVSPAAAAAEQRTPADLRFSDTDELYVENAGLVILWPFLETFFERLGLIGAKRFRDAAAAQRAAGLLQYVAAGDASPPEHLLPLNKVLCGLAAEEVFDFGDEITAREIEECTDLLAAVIRHATVLRDMSIDGFRGSFLLRKGQLRARDDHWLLRVERETYDIVLERFPWGMHLVRLPWMEAMMHVEW